MTKVVMTDEVQVLHFFETSPLERAEAVFNIVAYRMGERLRGGRMPEGPPVDRGRSRKRAPTDQPTTIVNGGSEAQDS